MRQYSFTEARQHFASSLEEAKREGVVCIKKRDGEAFYLKPADIKKSPLDVEGVNLGLNLSDVVDLVREGRERNYS